MPKDSFLSSEEERLSKEFLDTGYLVRACERPDLLSELKTLLLEESNVWLKRERQNGMIQDLSDSHLAITQSFLNDLRLHLFARLNARTDTRLNYFRLAKNLIECVVGNELAMQNKVNLSIQQPGDQSSVLELHSDVWSGDSPFQVVEWVPLTDSRSTNAMYLLRPDLSIEAYRRARNGELKSMSEIHDAYRDKFELIEVDFGQVLVFDSNCLHGNQLNTTSSTRWSLNCRVASLLAPATTPERRLGAYYTPITVRPATRMGLRAMEALGLID